MHHHLQILAQRHIEAKFVKINAEKALFFVDKVRDLNPVSISPLFQSHNVPLDAKTAESAEYADVGHIPRRRGS